jgi:hypothetical protein
MSDTPRTDANAFSISHFDQFDPRHYCVPAELSLLLERELNTANSQLAVARKDIVELKGLIIHADLHAAYRKAGYEQMTTEERALFDRVCAECPEEDMAEEIAP